MNKWSNGCGLIAGGNSQWLLESEEYAPSVREDNPEENLVSIGSLSGGRSANLEILLVHVDLQRATLPNVQTTETATFF